MKPIYRVSAEVRAIQSISFDLEAGSIEYGSIEDIRENIETEVYDKENDIVVASFDGDIEEELLGAMIKEAIIKYEAERFDEDEVS